MKVPTGAPEIENPAGCGIVFGIRSRGNDSSADGTISWTNSMSSEDRRFVVLARSATFHSVLKFIPAPFAMTSFDDDTSTADDHNGITMFVLPMRSPALRVCGNVRDS